MSPTRYQSTHIKQRGTKRISKAQAPNFDRKTRGPDFWFLDAGCLSCSPVPAGLMFCCRNSIRTWYAMAAFPTDASRTARVEIIEHIDTA